MNVRMSGMFALGVWTALWACAAVGFAAPCGDGSQAILQGDLSGTKALIDRPNPVMCAPLAERQRNMEKADQKGNSALRAVSGTKLAGQGRILMLLVEFGGTDTFQFTPGESTWDPYGRAQVNE